MSMEISKATPLFLLGSPRSGTTILTRILNAHPKVLLTDETSVILQLSDIVSKSKLGRKSGIVFGRSYSTLWSEHLSSKARYLIETYYERIRELENKSDVLFWGDKHPHHSTKNCLNFIDSLFPESCFIYIVRDPRDVALSISKMNKVAFKDALTTWKKFADQYESYFEKKAKGEYFLSIYEELAGNYQEKTKGILTWLGIPYVDEVDRFINEFKGVDVHKVSKKQWNDDIGLDTSDPGNKIKSTIKKLVGTKVKTDIDFSNSSVQKWKRELSRQEKKYAAKFAKNYLEKYGYER